VGVSCVRQRRLRLAVDIGGTFTDLVLLDEAEGRITAVKTLTTPGEPSLGVLSGIAKICAAAGAHFADVSDLVHGTTLVTNAVIERKGARTALVTTEGFRDLLEMARETSYDSYDLFLPTPAPLVPRYLRFTIRERVSATGVIQVPVADEDIDALCVSLRNAAVESVAVCFLNSFKNFANEDRVGQGIRRRLPGISVTTSSEVIPEIREYERFSTTVINAYTKPPTVRYVDDLAQRFGQEGFEGDFSLMLSNGGIIRADLSRQFPVRLIESGPAAGVLASAYYGRLTGHDTLVGFDMGGTTAKAGMVDGGQPQVTVESEVAREARFHKGSGLPVKVPSVDLIEIGAGGGSIARVDRLGLLKVGPRSSGADPGPACYGLGGQEATVTDADLLMGYLNADYFAGGDMSLDIRSARKALGTLAGHLGTDAVGVARGVFQIVNENMAQAIRVHIIEQGRDPRRYALVATGGAGPVHAYDVALRLGLSRLIVPFHGGVASAMGLLTAPVRLDYVQSYVCDLDQMDWDEVGARFGQMERQAKGELRGLPEDFTFERSADMRYIGQGYEIHVPLPDVSLDAASATEVRKAFHTAYEKVFGRLAHSSEGDVPIEVLNWRLTLLGPTPSRFTPNVERESHSANVPTPKPHVTRPVYFPPAQQPVSCPVFRHEQLQPGMKLNGPCVIEARQSAATVGPGGAVEVDRFLNLLIAVAPG